MADQPLTTSHRLSSQSPIGYAADPQPRSPSSTTDSNSSSVSGPNHKTRLSNSENKNDRSKIMLRCEEMALGKAELDHKLQIFQLRSSFNKAELEHRPQKIRSEGIYHKSERELKVHNEGISDGAGQLIGGIGCFMLAVLFMVSKALSAAAAPK